MQQTAPHTEPQPVVPRGRREPDPETTRKLWVSSGGRCEFRGCNKDLMEHEVTKLAGKFGERAHIYPFSERGPRAGDGARPDDVHDPANLMLLCESCHTLIDSKEYSSRFPRAVLEEHKREHEERIRLVTSFGPDMKTNVIVFTAPIRGATIGVPRDHVLRAIQPRYPAESDFVTIDLTALTGIGESEAFVRASRDRIDREFDKLFAQGGAVDRVPHISLVALGPMPLLMALGGRLDPKVPVDLYQRHRDTEDWSWKERDAAASFAVERLRDGQPGAPVTAVFSLSGSIALEDLPEGVRENSAIYEVRLTSAPPNPTFLNTRSDLEAFRVAYQELLGQIAQERGLVEAINVFPAVPAPLAVVIGRERLPKRHPSLRVYDFDRANGGFTYQLEVQ